MTSDTHGRPHLLTIPPDIRNRIYHSIVNDVKAVKMDACRQATGDILAVQDHPLSLASQQLRKEFRPVYAACAPQAADLLELRITNFALLDIFTLEPSEKPASDKPASDKPASDKPASDKPASDKTADMTTGIRQKRVVIYMTLTSTVYQTFKSLARYLLKVREQGKARGGIMRSFSYSTPPNMLSKSASSTLKYRVGSELDPRDALLCLRELQALQKLVVGDALGVKEWSQIMKAFHYGARKQLKRVKATVQRSKDDEVYLKQVEDAVARHRGKGT